MPELWTGFRDIDEAMPTDIREEIEDEQDGSDFENDVPTPAAESLVVAPAK
jgi:hypothetical protein